ncbi:MAG: hypothetical protein ACRYFS_03425 [Janthinobacterium lividum]
MARNKSQQPGNRLEIPGETSLTEKSGHRGRAQMKMVLEKELERQLGMAAVADKGGNEEAHDDHCHEASGLA